MILLLVWSVPVILLQLFQQFARPVCWKMLQVAVYVAVSAYLMGRVSNALFLDAYKPGSRVFQLETCRVNCLVCTGTCASIGVSIAAFSTCSFDAFKIIET